MAFAETTNTLNASQTQLGSSSGDQEHQWSPNPFFFFFFSEFQWKSKYRFGHSTTSWHQELDTKLRKENKRDVLEW